MNNERLEALLEKNQALYTVRALNCAETVLMTMCEYWGIPDGFYPRAATAFGGGLSGLQRTCGVFTGALMAIGIACGREPGGDQLPARTAGKAFAAWFEEKFGTDTCAKLTGIDLSDPQQAQAFRADGRHARICGNMVAETCRYLAARIAPKA